MPRKVGKPDRTAFLLSQVGSRSAQEFGKLLAPLGLTPADAGVLRLIGRSEGMSQQALSQALNVHASRLVALIDDLQSRGLVLRDVHPSDRRLYSLSLTKAGTEVLLSIRSVADEHNRIMCAALDKSETATLQSLLQKIAEHLGLTPGVHPGYRTSNKKSPPRIGVR